MRLDDRLAAIEVPALLVWGAKDQAPADVARDLAERMSDANHAVDAGHIPHIDQPDAAATAINGFPRKPAWGIGGAARRCVGRSSRARVVGRWRS
jgi:pimeloyl-ACP methyl ester carboxylesterase